MTSGNKKLLLVSANQLAVPYPVYPLGVSYLASYLKSRFDNYEIRIFDFINKNYDDFAQYLNDFNPDYTAVSLRNIDDVNIYKKTSYIHHYRTIIDNIKLHSKSVSIIGGPGFSIFPEKLFSFLEPDFAIYGEGEEDLFQLLISLDNNKDYRNINSLVFKEDNRIHINKKNTFIKKPDLCFDERMLEYYWEYSGMVNIQTKRGCPYNCIYCTYPVIDGQKVRALDSDRIVETLLDLQSKKIDYVFFTDSIFNIRNDFNIELANKIISHNIDIKWGAYFNFTNIDEKLLALLKKAGLTHIEFGTDSLSESMLKNYNKPFEFSDILEVSNICSKLNIDFANFLILGGNGETDDTINETFENCKKLPRTVFFPFIGIRIYPGTELYKLALSEGQISADDDLLEPKYYVSKDFDLTSLKEKAKATGRRWVFPDDDFDSAISKMRLKNKKGPLWEYLIQ